MSDREWNYDDEGTERMAPAPSSVATEEEGAQPFPDDSLISPEALMPSPDEVILPGAPVSVPPREAATEERRDTDEMPVIVLEERAQSDTGPLPPPGNTSDTGDVATPVSRQAEVLEADDLIGSYRILRWLGSGGIGEVYEAEHVYIGRRVALKVLRAAAKEDEDTVQRFFDEARVTNRVRHPNIIDITDLVIQPGEPPFIVMELLEGRDLASELLDAPFPLPFIKHVGRQVADALAALHEMGIAHRDLKPGNVFLLGDDAEQPEVRLIDFGVAKVLERDATINHQETHHGAVVGTIDYMSPEQAMGDAVDLKVDVFALGIVLHEMATGARPFNAQTLGELVFEFSTNPPTATGIKKRALRALVLACLAVDRARRPSMAEVLLALDKL